MSSDFGQQQFQRQQFKHKPKDLVKPVDHEVIRSRLKKPAMGLLVTGLVSVAIAIAALVGGILYSASNRNDIQRYWVVQMFGEEIKLSASGKGDSKRMVELKQKRDSQAQTAFTLVLGGIAIACLALASINMFYVSSGIMMGQLRNYRTCRVACIMALIPGISPLLVVGIPFAVLGLRQLAKSDVKKAFGS